MREARRKGNRILDLVRAFDVSEKTALKYTADIIPGGLRQPQADDDLIWEMKQTGLSNLEIARELKIADSVVWYALKRVREREKEDA